MVIFPIRKGCCAQRISTHTRPFTFGGQTAPTTHLHWRPRAEWRAPAQHLSPGSPAPAPLSPGWLLGPPSPRRLLLLHLTVKGPRGRRPAHHILTRVGSRKRRLPACEAAVLWCVLSFLLFLFSMHILPGRSKVLTIIETLKSPYL